MSDGRRPWWAFGCSDDLTERDLANVWRFNLYLFVLMATWLGAQLVLGADGVESPAVIAVVILPVLACVKFLQVAWRFVNEADELTRQIQVEGFAVGFGAGFVAILFEELAEEAQGLLAVGFDFPELFSPMMWMAVGYAFTVVRLQRGYCR